MHGGAPALALPWGRVRQEHWALQDCWAHCDLSLLWICNRFTTGLECTGGRQRMWEQEGVESSLLLPQRGFAGAQGEWLCLTVIPPENDGIQKLSPSSLRALQVLD